MRIEQIRFKNLNSLVGEWTMDLTHPAFRQDGIFAITGPTGAGKSTILDAICLALYGRTPRLGRITKGSNEIMSRQCGHCYAEVTFAVQKGRFRCHWSQHRAHRRAGGELQAPRHEIASADSGQVMETKLRNVVEQIEAITGMDFDRFTRSMLLAQGGFAAFLQASPDERAPILEQITGTEIYSRISMVVHERRGLERRRLDGLEAELAGMRLLNEEQQQALVQGLKEKTTQDAALQRELDLYQQALAWRQRLQQLSTELEHLARIETQLADRTTAFAPQAKRLERANKALELAADHQRLIDQRATLQAEQQQLHSLLAALPSRQEAVVQAEAMRRTASENLARCRQRQGELTPLIRTIRALDLQIAERSRPLAAASRTLAELEAAIKELEQRQHQEQNTLRSHQDALTQLRHQQHENAADEVLIEQLSAITERCNRLLQLHTQWQQRSQQLQQSAQIRDQAVQRHQETKARLHTEQLALAEMQQQLSDQEQARDRNLAGTALAVWRDQLTALTRRGELVARAGELMQRLLAASQQREALQARRDELTRQNEALAVQLDDGTKHRTGLEHQVALLETQLQLLRDIQDLTAARQHLTDGVPCPLCGATDHPFARGNLPVPDATQKHLDATKKALALAQRTDIDLKIRQAELDKDLERIDLDDRQQTELTRATTEQLTALLTPLDLDPSEPGLETRLDSLQEQTRLELAQTVQIVKQADQAELCLDDLRQRLDRIKTQVVATERQVQAAEHGCNVARQQTEQATAESSALHQQWTLLRDTLAAELKDYQVAPPEPSNLTTLLDSLNKRRNAWLKRQQHLTELQGQAATLEVRLRHQDEQLVKMRQDQERQQQQCHTLHQEQAALVEERQRLFAEKNPDQEELVAHQAVENAEKALDLARQQTLVAQEAQTSLKARIEELTQAIDKKRQNLIASEPAFLRRLHAAEFADEAHYQAACLEETERTALAAQARELAEQETELKTRLRETKSQLAREQERRLTEAATEALHTTIQDLLNRQKALQQEIGGLEQQRRHDAETRQQQQARLAAIAEQQQEYVRWDALHNLIGSADGKRYRNFAQGLTFDLMIGHANQQLQRMTDRYLLIRDQTHPLELNVVDSYQAGDIRTTKNLSGGESFLVSLALALGLSQMASRKVRVDSLFLDEGFGTLDDEALDTALETLAGLQQEGKLIGIISHVAALKERIANRIEVSPSNRGRSVLTGPGCSQGTA